MFKNTYNYFKEICKIPHGSGNEKALSDYLINFFLDFGLKAKQDNVGNVIVWSPSNCKDLDNNKTIHFLAHIDMVCNSAKDKKIDMSKCALDLYEEDGWLKAKDTTLGADDGVGVALIMELLTNDNIKHGPLVGILTVEEETTCRGVMELERFWPDNAIFISLDSMSFDAACFSSLGCEFYDLRAELEMCETKKVFKNPLGMKVTISNLIGGHSGATIHEHRINGIISLVEMVSEIAIDYPISIVSFESSKISNAIPDFASAEIVIEMSNKTQIFELLKHRFDSISRVNNVDINPHLDIKELNVFSEKAISRPETKRIMARIRSCPNGIERIEINDITGYATLASSCLTILSIKENKLQIKLMGRFLNRDILESQKIRILSWSSLFKNSICLIKDALPGMDLAYDSDIVKKYAHAYEKTLNIKPMLKRTAGGGDLSYIYDSTPNMQGIIIGPTILDYHTPSERLNIKTFEQLHDVLLELIGEII